MAAEQGGQEKTEQPSDKKRQDTRKEGNVAFSKENLFCNTACPALL